MKYREWIYIILNLVASVFYFIAFATKNLTYLGIGGGILVINSLVNLIRPKKKNRI